MTGRRDWLGSALSREWFGLPLGGLLGLTAAAARRGSAPRALALAPAGVGALLALGSTVHLMRLRQARRRFPPPGRLVDIGGYRVHVLAEGKAEGVLPVVMFGGGHAAGLSIDHLHRALREETRSILIDRPGTGWSDTGPFPRTTAREADEIVDALARTSETGPLLFVGYSFGGLLAANIARRHPELVARLVLLDPTPLETLVFGPPLKAARDMRWDEFKTGLAKLFGWNRNVHRRRVGANPAHDAARRAFEAALGPEAVATLERGSESAGAHFANWSILRELEGPHIGRCGWETVVYDGDLGDLPVWLVAPGSAEDVISEPEVGGASAGEQARMIRFYARTRERYLAASSNSRRIFAPPGSTHQFVYEHPRFVIDVLREAIQPRAAP